MKKYSIILLSVVFAALALSSCKKEVEIDNTIDRIDASYSVPFTLVADIQSPETKTTLNTSTWAVDWDNNDIIYAVTTDEEWGVAYNTDNSTESIAEFVYDASTESFKTTSTISDGEHTFNFLYSNGSGKSYHRGLSTTFSLSGTQAFDASNPGANLKSYDALAAQLTETTPATLSNVSMSHLFSLMKVTLKNKTGNELTATKLELSAANAELYGVHTVAFSATPSVTYKNNGGNQLLVNISNGTIASDGTLDVYFVIAPLSNYSGDITFKVTASNGNTFTKTNTVSGVTFAAGSYNTASLSLKTADAVECVTLPWKYEGGTSSNLNAVPGVTTSGLGSDYADTHAPNRVKFDTAGDYIQVRTDSAIESVEVGYKKIGGAGNSKLVIYESSNGVDWGESLEELTLTGEQNYVGTVKTSASFSSTSRFVKIEFNKSANVGIGTITILKNDSRDDVILSFATPSYNLAIGTDDYTNFSGQTATATPSVEGITYSLSGDAIATVNETSGAISLNGTAGTATITASFAGNETYKPATDVSYAIVVTDPNVVDYVTLPWNDYTGGTSSDLNAVTGVTTDGLGTDYAAGNAPYRVRLDDTGDYIQIKTDSAIGSVSIGYKMFGSSTSYLNIFESTDGVTWGTGIDRLTISGNQNSTGTLTTDAVFNANSRFVKIVFEKGGNVGIGAISIDKPNTDPVISADNIANVPAIGVSNAEATYTVLNFTDDVEVASYVGCVTDAIAAAGTIVYSVSPNYATSATSGTIVLQSAADNTVTKTITVSQLRSSLSVSASEVVIPADGDEITFTVTSPEFDWMITADDDSNIIFDETGTASASPTTVTVISNITATDAEQTIATLTIIRNANDSDPQAKTVVVKKAAVTANTPYSTGFESSEGFTAGTDYQNTVTAGPTGGNQWKVYYGTPSTSSAISGSQSLAMRLYTSANYGYAEMLFDVPGATGVSFKAKAATTNSASIKLTIKESKDGGATWTVVSGWSAHAVASSATDYSFTVSGNPSKYRIRFEIDSSSTKPSTKNAQLTIDDFSISVN